MNTRNHRQVVYCCECCGRRLAAAEGKICGQCARRIDTELRALRLGQYSACR